MHVKLVVVEGDVKTSEVRLKIPAIIGRGRGASLQIPQALVSRQHCELSFADGKLRVRDLGSLNGTVVEGKKITDAEIVSGQTLTIGSVTFRIEYGDGASSSGDWKVAAKGAAAGTDVPGAVPPPPAVTPAEVMFEAVGAEPAPQAFLSDPSGSSTGTRKGMDEESREPRGDGNPSSDVMSGFERGAGLLPPLAEPVGMNAIPPTPAARHFIPPTPPVPAIVQPSVPPLAIPVASPVPPAPAIAPQPAAAPPAASVPPAASSSDDDDEDLRAFLQSLGK